MKHNSPGENILAFILVVMLLGGIVGLIYALSS